MKRTWEPVIAGILNIISGAFFLVGGIIIVGLLGQPTLVTPWASYTMYSMGLSGTPSESFVTKFIITLAAMLIIPGVVSILGGAYCLKRSAWGLALAGSISTFVFTIFLGVLAIALTALSKKEFG